VLLFVMYQLNLGKLVASRFVIKTTTKTIIIIITTIIIKTTTTTTTTLVGLPFLSADW